MTASCHASYVARERSRAKLRRRALALALLARAGSWYAWRQPAHGFVAAGCAMSPRTIWPKQPRPRLHSCDQSGHDRKTGANLFNDQATPNVRLHRGLGTWTQPPHAGSKALAHSSQVCRRSNHAAHAPHLVQIQGSVSTDSQPRPCFVAGRCDRRCSTTPQALPCSGACPPPPIPRPIPT